MSDYDLVVIGAGAAGIGAARAATWVGRSVALVNDGAPGGDCTFTGCVPSKTLIARSRAGATLPDALAEVGRVVARIAATEDAEVLGEEGIDVIDGRARFVSSSSVEIDGAVVSGDKIVIATGATPVVPPITGLREAPYRTTHDIWELPPATERLAILGGGPIGCELAMAFSGLGLDVSVYELAPRLLVREDPEAAAIIEDALRDRGVGVHVGAGVEEVRADPAGITVRAGEAVGHHDEVLVALGRRPVTDGLALELAGVEVDERGHIRTDAKLRTNVSNIAAAGDVTGRLPFTHAAYEMGRLATSHLFRKGARWRFDESAIPWVTYTDPEVATFGMNEPEAAEIGGTVAYLPLDGVDRALTEGRTDGFIKIIAAPKKLTRGLFAGRIVGATIVAPRAGEMIHELALAARTNMFAGRVAQLSHAYPSWSSGVQKAMAQFFYELEGRTARPARRAE